MKDLKRNHVTINDVAKSAGVSPSTVSRVISNSSKISVATKEKVVRHMKELGYYPNAIARSLAKNKTGNIGIIMPSRSEDIFLNPFFPEALRGITRAASKNGYDLLLSTNLGEEDELINIKSLINTSKVDGIVLMSSKIKDESIDYLHSIDFPFSLIGTPSISDEGITYVDNDNKKATYGLTMHLTSMGRTNIAMIAGDPDLMVTRTRIEGYKKAMEEKNLKFDKELLFIGSFDEETGHHYGRELLKLSPRPDAVIATDDLIAFGAMQVLENYNINIPLDIAIASFNNSFLSRFSHTPFTSVDINAFNLGSTSITLLVNLLEKGRVSQRKIIPYEIHVRNSTKIF